jgi:DNA topoisomerase 2-associated protein PAT1
MDLNMAKMFRMHHFRTTDRLDLHPLRVCPSILLYTRHRSSRPLARLAQSVWEDRSPFSALGRAATSNREERSTPTSFSPFDGIQSSHTITQERVPPARADPFAGQRTMQEVEAEMRLAAMRAREQAAYQQQLAQQASLHRQTPPMQGAFADVPQILRHELQQQQQTRTPPPPRMHPHSQSPRFHQQLQQQILLNRQNEQNQLRDLQQQLQMEQLTRQMRQAELVPTPQQQRGYISDDFGTAQMRASPTIAELRAQELQQMRRQSPAFDPHIQQLSHQQGGGLLPDNIQMQQYLLHQAANEQFKRDMGTNEQIHLRIMEAERMEEKRRRKAAKLAHMVSVFGINLDIITTKDTIRPGTTTS